MKLQTLTVIFIIIILPITMVVSEYITTEISTINTQTEYDTILNNATYDAMKAFQLNESNSTTSNIPTEKIRDVEASKNSFYNSLASSMGVAGYTENELNSYIPCLVYTLYDGYYIYTKNSDGNYILKPYVYYTERIGDYVISYTLDSYVSVIGSDGTTKSGYLYNSKNDLLINEQEELKENIEFNGTLYNVSYVYKKWNDSDSQYLKYYYLGSKWYSLGTDGKLTEETRMERLNELNEYNKETGNVVDKSAKEYKDKYNNNNGFTEWVTKTLSNEKNEDGKTCTYLNFSPDTDNDPDKYSSPFNEHRRKVIQDSIKSNLEATIVNYRGSAVEFQMPELDETEWDKIINNVSLISFMQGLPLKNKYYRGYSVVTNTQSREFVDPDEIYLLTEEMSEKRYHKITWTGFKDIEPLSVAYRNVDFRRKTYIGVGTGGTKQDMYYYPQDGMADYESIVTSKEVYVADNNLGNDIEEAMKGDNIKERAKRAYYTALYRERYINYKSLNFGN